MKQFTKKQKVGAVVGLALLGLVGLGTATHKSVKPGATECKDLPSCQQSCTTQGCFCNRSCILWYCWGPWYCQCG